MSSDSCQIPDLQIEDYFTIFVYPFEHQFSSRDDGLFYEKDRDAFLNKICQEGWCSWLSRFEEGDDRDGPLKDLKTMFHPPTLEALYPEIYRLERCGEYYSHSLCDIKSDSCSLSREEKIECQKKLFADLLKLSKEPWEKSSKLWEKFQKEDSIRLTFDFGKGNRPDIWKFTLPPEPRKGSSGRPATSCLKPWELTHSSVPEKGGEEFIFKIHWMDAYLFPFQIGFLCFKITLIGTNGNTDRNLERLMLFHQTFRDINSSGTITADSRNGGKLLKTKKEFISFWLSSLQPEKEAQSKKKNPKTHQLSIADQAYRFKIFSFISLEPNDLLYEKTNPFYQELEQVDILLYEIASTSKLGTLNKTDDSSKGWHPSKEYLKDTLLTKNGINIWRYWRGMALKDTVSFLSIRDGVQPKADQYEHAYFPLYIYVYNLKMQLFMLSTELNLRRKKWNDPELNRLIERFYLFRNEFWFSEISPNFQMAILFEKFKWGLEVHVDYEGVVAEVNDTFHYQEAHINRRLSLWVMVLTLGALVVGFFGMNPLTIKADEEPFQSLWNGRNVLGHLLSLLGLGVIVASGIFWLGKKIWTRNYFQIKRLVSWN